eukprot:SAG31_NODE_6085_length_2178_cov_2.675325_1_plen_102_part_00
MWHVLLQAVLGGVLLLVVAGLVTLVIIINAACEGSGALKVALLNPSFCDAARVLLRTVVAVLKRACYVELVTHPDCGNAGSTRVAGSKFDEEHGRHSAVFG